MFVRADAQDKASIYRIWKDVFSHDDHGTIDFFFEHTYKPENTYLIKENHEIISGCNVLTHTMMLFDQPVLVSYLVGVFTKPQYQGQGYMKQLVNQVLAMLSNQHLITVLMAYNPKVYRSLGFKEFVYHQQVQLKKAMIPALSTMNITYQVSAKQLHQAYHQFMQYFTGYKVRSVADFELLQQEALVQNGKVVAYVEDQQVKGYMVYLLQPLQVEILEIIYFETDTLLRLLHFASNLNQQVKVHISAYENWAFLFPKAIITKEPFLFARINDVYNFNECFNTTITGIDDLVVSLRKPLFFNEYQ